LQIAGIDDDSTVGASGSLFGPVGGVCAATFMNDVFYGGELSNETSIDYLVTIPHTGDLVGRVIVVMKEVQHVKMSVDRGKSVPKSGLPAR
jgi:hypothetical protein